MKIINLLLLSVILGISCHAYAQSASDILESGVKITSTNQINVEFSSSPVNLRYQAFPDKKLSFVSFKDSAYFLPNGNVNIFIKTLNPLNFSAALHTIYVDDAIVKAQNEALANLMKGLQPVIGGTGAAKPATFDNINANLAELKADLTNSYKASLAEQFTKLKSIDFDTDDYDAILKDINNKYLEIEEKYKGFTELASSTDAMIRDYKEAPIVAPAPPPAPPGKKPAGKAPVAPPPPVAVAAVTVHDEVLARQVFTSQLTDLKTQLTAQLKWLANLKVAYDLVIKAKKTKKDNGSLVTSLGEVQLVKGKVAVSTITISQDGMKLNADNDIIAEDKKTLLTKVIRFREFQRFVFEFAAGIAFAAIDYPKYGTTTDAAGNTVVGSPTYDSFKKFKLSAMFNWNYYIDHSAINPFVQLGAGANTDYPALFMGLGLRFNSPGSKHLAISGGFAASWIKNLNKLKVGDKVTGTADIDKDITTEFRTPLAPYLGIQINF